MKVRKLAEATDEFLSLQNFIYAVRARDRDEHEMPVRLCPKSQCTELSKMFCCLYYKNTR